ncbi:hypothetical protein [Streptomyces sp. HC307]|uniref:hypothetical protein n=1 Tax=Streptomyces flavusporus TaxID=3385496 RepID=UPI003916D7A1
MSDYEREIRKLADYHAEQATELERNSSDDAYFTGVEGARREADRARAIQSHRRKAAELTAEAARLTP